MKNIKREQYLNQMIHTINTLDIKVITGVRRSGKSKLLDCLKKYIEAKIENYNIVYINYSLTKFEKLKEYHNLVEYVEKTI